MANAPSKFASRGGHFKDGGVAAVAIPQCQAVMRDGSGNLILATAGLPISGVSVNTYAIGEAVTLHVGGEKTVDVTGATVVPGDILKVGASAGIFGPDATSGSTAPSVNMIGRALTTKDADGLVMMESFGQ